MKNLGFLLLMAGGLSGLLSKMFDVKVVDIMSAFAVPYLMFFTKMDWYIGLSLGVGISLALILTGVIFSEFSAKLKIFGKRLARNG